MAKPPPPKSAKPIKPAKAPRFAGFSKNMPAFFRQLEKNNSREWFAPRKEKFEEQVRRPMIELVSIINDELKKFAIDYAVADPKKALYRIYRDTRFSKDKTPYKTHIGAMFGHKGLSKNGAAGFYVGVSHKEVEVAGGMYMPGPEEITVVRRAIADRPGEFLKLVMDAKLKKAAGPLLGSKLTRPPRGFEAHADSPAAEFLRHKQWYWYIKLPANTALSGGIVKAVVARFQLLARPVEWLNAVVLEKLKEGEGAEPVTRRPAPMW